MKKSVWVFVALAVIFFIFSQSGCGQKEANPIASRPGQTETETFPEKGVVSVAFQFVPESFGNSPPNASIVSATGVTPQVTFKLTLINIGNTANPTTILAKTVPAVNGVASASFQGIPARTCIGEILIEGGKKGIYSDFHGALDLKSGSNTLFLAGKGSREMPDFVAYVIEKVLATPSLSSKIVPGMAEKVSNSLAGLNIGVQTAYDTAFNSYSSFDFETDSDGDGIPDGSEQPGTTLSSLPFYDWGARANQKDIFIHIDYMDSTDLGVLPRKEALDKIKGLFANRGYAVHFDVGSLYGNNPADYCLENYEHKVPFNAIVSFSTSSSDTTSIYFYKNNYLNPAKKQIFHYLLMGYKSAIDAAGQGEMRGNDFYVALGGSQSSSQGITWAYYQAAVIMHELGHNLGLAHGGNEENQYKPNYVSIMNYMYAGLKGLPIIGNTREGDRYYYYRYLGCDGGSATSTFRQYFSGGYSVPVYDYLHNNIYMTTSWVMDYSNGEGGSIDEAVIDERAGLTRPGSAGVDYNGNGSCIDSGFTMDLNYEGKIGVLSDSNDWANIYLFVLRDSSGFSAGKFLRPGVDSGIEDDHQPVAEESPAIMRIP